MAQEGGVTKKNKQKKSGVLSPQNYTQQFNKTTSRGAMHTSQLRSVRREPALGACIPFDENLVLKPVNRYSFFLLPRSITGVAESAILGSASWSDYIASDLKLRVRI